MELRRIEQTMICKKCGTENQEQFKYCKKCGALLVQRENGIRGKQPMKQVATEGGNPVATGGTMSYKTRAIAGIIILVAIVASVVAFLLYSNNQKKAEYNGVIETADQYLEALDYEKAETAYLKAINIQPKKEEAYVKLADLYTDQGQYDDAIKILEKGEEHVKSGELTEKLVTVETLKDYAPVLKQYRDIEEHGSYEDAPDEMEAYINDGLLELMENLSDGCDIYYALKDTDGNGIEELILGAGEDKDSIRKFDILTLSEHKPVRIFPDWMFNDDTLYFTIYEGGTIELGNVVDVFFMSSEYYRMKDDGYTPRLVESISLRSEDTGETRYYHDLEGKVEISKEEFTSIQNKYGSQEKMVFDWKPLKGKVNIGDNAEQYKAYYDVCANYKSKYGEGSYEGSGVADDEQYACSLTGLCFASLFDFNQDGNNELILGYLQDASAFPKYKCDIWAWQEGGAAHILKQADLRYTNDGSEWIEVVDGEEGILFAQNIDGTQYLRYDGKSFQAKYIMSYPEDEILGTAQINGEPASANEINDLQAKLGSYDYTEDYVIKANKMRVPVSFMSEEMAQSILRDTQETMDLLKK